MPGARDEGPVQPGDRLLLAPGLTGLREPVWAAVDLVEPLNTSEGAEPGWKVGYRINIIGRDDIRTQLGVAVLDDEGHGGHVLALDTSGARAQQQARGETHRRVKRDDA